MGGMQVNTGDFDDRNLAKSRAVIDAMDEVAGTGMRKLSERERKILDMWPRFDDGEYVWFGDEVDGLSGGIVNIELFERATNLCGMFASHIHLSVDERVKLPEPEVLDVDGVEIKVGDTVWRRDGGEWIAEETNRYGARCFDGDRRRTFDPRCLTHTRPDSWERLEEDAQKNACDYFCVECDSEAKCRMCPHFQDDRDCSLDMNADIVRRAKKLAGVIGK